jgi:(2Fe-2S) ferredoxin
MSDVPTLLVCANHRLGTNAGSCAGGGGGIALAEALRTHLAERGLGWNVAVTGCLGYCRLGPNIKAAPGGPFLHGCQPDQAEALVDRLLTQWNPGQD